MDPSSSYADPGGQDIDVGRSRPLNINLFWGPYGGNYLLVDGGVIALTVTIKLLTLLMYQLGNRGELINIVHAMGEIPQ